MDTATRRREVEQQASREQMRQLFEDPAVRSLIGVLNEGGVQGAVDSGASTQEIKQAAIAAGRAFGMIRGDTEWLDTTATQADGITALDLTGATIYCTAKLNPGDADPGHFQKTNATGGGITVTNAPGGIMETKIVKADTSGLTATTTLFWDIQVTTAAGNSHTIDWGTIDVDATWDITRA